MSHEPRTETEWKLAIVADSPQRQIDHWSNAPAEPFDPPNERFRLGPAREVRQRDTYLDTPDGRLGDGRIALRVRTFEPASGRSPRITLKAGARTSVDGLARRPEEEFDFDDPESVVTRVRSILANQGVELSPVEATPASGANEAPEPIHVLCKAFGLVVVQDRITRRVTRTIHAALDDKGAPAACRSERVDANDGDGGSCLLGELALDTVSFAAGERVVTHREIEVEALDDDTAARLESFVTALRHASGDDLAPFELNKLALGFELELAARAGTLDGHLDERGNLLPSFYAALGSRATGRQDSAADSGSP